MDNFVNHETIVQQKNLPNELVANKQVKDQEKEALKKNLPNKMVANRLVKDQEKELHSEEYVSRG